MIRVYPAINKTNKGCFTRALKRAEELSAVIDIDIADGKFIKHKTISMNTLKDVSSHRFNVHYMGLNPLKRIGQLPDNTWQYQFHYEACGDGVDRVQTINEIITACKKIKVKPVLAISPDTKVSEIKDFIKNVYGIHLLTVYPGKSRQHLLTWVMRKVGYLKKIDSKMRVGIDGGVNLETAELIRMYPLDYVSVTSAIFDSPDPAKAYKNLKKKLNR